MTGHIVHELGCSEPCSCGAVDRVIEEPECIHGLGPISACTICNGRDERQRAERDGTAYSFEAKFHGHCGRCGQPVEPGERLTATNDGRYLCEDCAP